MPQAQVDFLSLNSAEYDDTDAVERCENEERKNLLGKRGKYVHIEYVLGTHTSRRRPSLTQQNANVAAFCGLLNLAYIRGSVVEYHVPLYLYLCVHQYHLIVNFIFIRPLPPEHLRLLVAFFNATHLRDCV